MWDSTNRHGWSNFLIELKKLIQEKHVRGPVTLVIDNHKVHWSYAVRKHYEGFHVLFLPAYSSFLNP